MEAKVNLGLLAVLGLVWAGVTLAEPAAALPRGASTQELAELEDAYAADRNDPLLAREIADRYLTLQQPELAIAAVRAATPEVREDPAVLHRLAQAYEETGQMGDAVATAHLALTRCARAIGTVDSSEVTPVPTHGCDERTYAALDMHATALVHMARWGVTDVQNDPRSRSAYVLAVRNARILSARAE
jgi:hypothetical protein